MTLRKAEKIVRKLDKNLKPESEEFKAAVVLLIAADHGTNDARVARITGYPYELVNRFGRNLRKSGVWKKGKTVHSGWFDKQGGLAFWLDVCIAQGFIARSR